MREFAAGGDEARKSGGTGRGKPRKAAKLKMLGRICGRVWRRAISGRPGYWAE